MNLPKKINPDNITNSLVHVYYWSEIPNIASIGYIYGHLNTKDYLYIDNNSIEDQLYVNEGKGVKVQFSLFNEIKILSFNCIDKYLGWEDYSNEIKSVIKTLFENNVIRKVQKIKLHYTSAFEENIFDNLKLNIDFDSFSSSKHEYFIKNIEYNINFLLEINSDNNYIMEIIVENSELKELKNILAFNKLLDKVHLKEKEAFFSLVSKKKLTELNPEY